jgi:N-dimethylarginine dimethylaminohydrolase
MGHGHRSDLAAAQVVSALLDIEVVPLRLVDPRFYHLDTCLCPLEGGTLLYYPAAFDEASQAEIEKRVPISSRMAVDQADALRFACNAVNVGASVFFNDASNALRTQLELAGFESHVVPLGEFLKSGGGAKCLTLRLDEPAGTNA